MEWILLAALLIFLLGALASWFWLVRSAFIDGPAWGWAVLLIPFAGIVYGILAWREAHRPLLINLGMTLLSYMTYAMLVSTQPQYEIHNLYNRAETQLQHWIAEFNKPKAWEVDPEVIGTVQPDDDITAARQETASEPVSETPPPPVSNPVIDASAEEKGMTAPEATETPPPVAESEPLAESKGEKNEKKGLLKTRVIRIGATNEKDRMAPYRQLTADQRIARLNELMWQPMVVCLRRGGTRKGTLEELSRDSLTLRQRLASGNFDSIVPLKRVRDILLPRPGQPLNELRCEG